MCATARVCSSSARLSGGRIGPSRKCSVSCTAGFSLSLNLWHLSSERRRVASDKLAAGKLKGTHMFYMLGIVTGLLSIIMLFSKGLQKWSKPKSFQSPESSVISKLKDLNEEDVHLLAKILSVGLVDADPNYLQHLKGYRDLGGA